MKLMYLLVVDGRYQERYYDRKHAEESMRDYGEASIACQLYITDGEGYKQLVAVRE